MKSRHQQFIQLAIAVSAIVVVWCGLLPRVSNIPVVQQRLQFLDDKGIDPSAMYYTELEAMDAILDRIEGRVENRVATTGNTDHNPTAHTCASNH